MPALLAFNVGVEVGQLAFVGVLLLTMAAVRSLDVAWPRADHLGLCGGRTRAFWICERIAAITGGAA